MQTLAVDRPLYPKQLPTGAPVASAFPSLQLFSTPNKRSDTSEDGTSSSWAMSLCVVPSAQRVLRTFSNYRFPLNPVRFIPVVTLCCNFDAKIAILPIADNAELVELDSSMRPRTPSSGFSQKSVAANVAP